MGWLATLHGSLHQQCMGECVQHCKHFGCCLGRKMLYKLRPLIISSEIWRDRATINDMCSTIYSIRLQEENTNWNISISISNVSKTQSVFCSANEQQTQNSRNQSDVFLLCVSRLGEIMALVRSTCVQSSKIKSIFKEGQRLSHRRFIYHTAWKIISKLTDFQLRFENGLQTSGLGRSIFALTHGFTITSNNL